jgi:hypothetical protein
LTRRPFFYGQSYVIPLTLSLASADNRRSVMVVLSFPVHGQSLSVDHLQFIVEKARGETRLQNGDR